MCKNLSVKRYRAWLDEKNYIRKNESMEPTVKISDAESQIMAALWATGPMGAEEIAAEVGIEAGWSEATVRTLINRLIKKKAIVAEREGRRARYHPLLSRDDYVTEEAQSLLDRLFEGHLSPLLAHFSEKGSLREDEIEALRAIVGKMDLRSSETTDPPDD